MTLREPALRPLVLGSWGAIWTFRKGEGIGRGEVLSPCPLPRPLAAARRGREGLGGAGVALGAEGDSGFGGAGRRTPETCTGNRREERTTRWGCDSCDQRGLALTHPADPVSEIPRRPAAHTAQPLFHFHFFGCPGPGTIPRRPAPEQAAHSPGSGVRDSSWKVRGGVGGASVEEACLRRRKFQACSSGVLLPICPGSWAGEMAASGVLGRG